MPSVLHTASMIFRKFYDEYVTTKDPAMGEAGVAMGSASVASAIRRRLRWKADRASARTGHVTSFVGVPGELN